MHNAATAERIEEWTRDSARAAVFVMQPAEMRDRVDGAVAVFYGARLGRVAVE